MKADRFTLAAITVTAVLAATIAAVQLPEWILPGFLTWAVVYVGAVLGTAHLVGMPAGRVLVASTLMLATTAALLLTLARDLLDAAIRAFAQLNARGLASLAKEATAA